MALLITLTSLPLSFAVGVSAADNEALIIETNTQYATLEEAITAAESGQTIKLLADVNIASGAGIIINAKKDVIIDGDNHTVSSTIDTANRAAFYIQSGSLTLKNLTLNVESKVAGCWGAIISRFEGTVGTFDNCKINVSGAQGMGTISANTKGKVIVKNSEIRSTLPLILNYDGSCFFEAENSTAYGTSVGAGEIAGLNFTQTDSPFDATVPSEDDKEDENTPKVEVAAIGDKTYYSLPEAFKDAKNGDVIKLLCDIDVTTTGTGGRIKCYGAGIDLTLDGNGKTITGIADTTLAIHYQAAAGEDNGGALNLTIKNLTIGNKVGDATQSGTALQVNSSTVVTLVNTTVKSEANKWASTVIQASGSLIVADGAKIIAESGNAVLLNGEAATISVYGGSIEAEKAIYSRNSFSTVNICQGAVVKAKNQVISADSTAGLTVNLLGGSVISENADTGVFTLPDEQYKVNILSGHIEGGKRIISKTTNRKDNLEYPEGKTSVDYNISASDQINIRFANNSSGLRFETLISAEVIALAEALKDADSEISYGTVITPAENLAAANGIIDMSVLENIDANGTKYIRVKAKDGKIDNADGSVTVRASLVNIKAENYGREFAAAGYLSIMSGGKRIYLYSNAVKQNVKDAAYTALADVSENENGDYSFPVTSYYKSTDNGFELTEGAAFSKYAPARVAILNNYVSGVLNHDPNSTANGEPPLADQTKQIIGNTYATFRTLGRTYTRNSGLACDFACTGIEFTALCEGEIFLNLNSTAQAYLTVYIDGERFDERISVSAGTNWVRVAYGIERGEHTVMIVNQSQFNMATLILNAVKISGEFKEKPADRELFFEFYGDSILNGSNVFLGGTSAKTSDATYAFGWIASQHLDADCSIMGHGGLGLVASKNSYNMVDLYDLCGSATLSGVPKYDFARKPDAVVIELGVNDYANGGLSGKPETYAAGVKKFIGDLRAKYGEDVPIVWIYGYRDDAKDFWATTKTTLDGIIAAGDNNIHYCKVSKAYLTSAQGGDGWHPNVKMAETFGKEVADFLKTIVK